MTKGIAILNQPRLVNELRSPPSGRVLGLFVLIFALGIPAFGQTAQPPQPSQPQPQPSQSQPAAQPAPALQPQSQSPQPQAYDQTMNRAWRLEKVNPDEDWTRHFRLGALVGLNIKARFTLNGPFNVSGNNPANGIYDDGYEREDNTGNAGG